MSEIDDGAMPPLPAQSSRHGSSRSSSSSSRSRRRSRSRRSSAFDRVRPEVLQRLVTFAVALGLVLFLVLSIKHYSDYRKAIGFYYLNNSKNDILYVFGPPKRVRSGEGTAWTAPASTGAIAQFDQWGYTTPSGGSVDIVFGGSGQSERIACADAESRLDACPRTFDVTVGDGEDRLVYQMGRPAQQSYRGPDKLMAYPELGLTFTLRELRIRKIELERRTASSFDVMMRYLRAIVP